MGFSDTFPSVVLDFVAGDVNAAHLRKFFTKKVDIGCFKM